MNKIKRLIITLLISFIFCGVYAADLESEKTYEVEVNGRRIERVIKTTCRNGYIYISFYDSQEKGFDHLGAIVRKGNSNYTYSQNNEWEETNSTGLDLSKLDDKQTIRVGIVPTSIIQECRIKTGMDTSTFISVHDSIQLPFAKGFNGCEIYLLGIKDGVIKEILKGKISSELLKAETAVTVNKNETIEGKVYEKFISNSEENRLVREELATLFAYSIQNGKVNNGEQFYYNPGIIEKNCSPYLKSYINTLYEKKYPVLASQIYDAKWMPEFKEIDSETVNNLIEAAEYYLNWAVEYTVVGTAWADSDTEESIKRNEIYSTVDKDWGKTQEDTKTDNYWPKGKDQFPENGYPMPYVKNGIDTPRTFWKKMQWVYKDSKFLWFPGEFLKNAAQRLSDSATGNSFETFDIDTYKGKFVAGTGDDIFRYAGTDGLGFFTGVLSMSGAEESFSGENSKKAAENLDKYSKELTYLTDKNEIEKVNNEYISSLTKLSNARFNLYDVEYFSILVPDYTKVKAGDFVVKPESEELGIIVALPETVTKDNLNNVKVIYIDKNKVSDSKFFTGYAKIGTLDTFKDKEFTLRRLVTNNSTGGKVYDRDVLDKTFSGNTELTVDKFTEMGSQDPNSWRFIPNTGEFLVLEGIKLVAKNNAGVNVIALYSEDPKYEYTVEEFYAKDRAYNNATNQTVTGNIYNNAADEFEIIPFNGMNTIIKGNGGTINESVYKIKNNETDKSVYRSNMASKDSGNKLVLKINPDGTFKTDSGNYAKVNIGIRPVTAAKAFPGDDLILGIKFEGIEEPLYLDEKDYVAVYDKKMLWRANLYLDEKESTLGNLDWNNAHPWNAPADENAANIPQWWDGAENLTAAQCWGYNQWNRVYDINTEDSQQTDLTNLNYGDGTQVVKFASWTPLRTRTVVGKNTNLFTDRVCYDYPMEKNSAGEYINAWDSPFDFNLKMINQKKSIKEHFSNEVAKIKQEYKTEKERNEKLNAKGIFPNGANSLGGNKISVKDLAAWTQTTAPNSGWKFYWKKIDLQSDMKPYIPGLGLYIEYPNNPNNEALPTPFVIENKKYSAGADCLGFAERAASYKGNIYKWTDLPEGRIEGKDSDSIERVPDSETTKAHFPQTEGTSFLILTKESIGDEETYFTKDYVEDNDTTSGRISKTEFKDVKQKFLKVIPGDIITYDKSHIGIIREVNSEGINNAKNIKAIMDNITVVESFYGSTYNYVMKRQSTDGVKIIVNTKTYYTGSWFYGWADGVVINMRNFQIERLMFN